MVFDFTNLVLNDVTPIYMQIIQHVKMGIVSGQLLSGDELPSRRALSALIGVNPNTIQKAYKIMEEEELIESYLGSKSIVIATEEKASKIREELIIEATNQYIQLVQQMGYQKEDAARFIEDAWKNKD